MTPTGRKRTLLITDLDNTLWDWFAAWHASFSAMLDRLTQLSGVPASVLEPQIRGIHQARGTAEYSHLLNELPALREAAWGVEPMDAYDEALHVLASERKKVTRLYPEVRATLEQLRAQGVTIVAYTESVAYWTEWRIRHTGLDGVIDVLYSAPDHDLPNGVSIEDLRKRPDGDYGLKLTEHRATPKGSRKPNADILLAILEDAGHKASEAVYVGDSLMKDIAMAQQVGVLDAHAKYGLVQEQPEYDLLRAVTHWTDVDVAREKLLANNGEVTATVTLEKSFSEVLPLFGLTQVKHDNE